MNYGVNQADMLPENRGEKEELIVLGHGWGCVQQQTFAGVDGTLR